MPKRSSDYHSWLLTELADPHEAANYLNAAMEDSPEMFLKALRNVAEAHKMAKVATVAGVAREALYKTLSEEGNPRLYTLDAVLKATGLQIAVAPRGSIRRTSARKNVYLSHTRVDSKQVSTTTNSNAKIIIERAPFGGVVVYKPKINKVNERGLRKGRNPQTGDEIIMAYTATKAGNLWLSKSNSLNLYQLNLVPPAPESEMKTS